MRRQSSVGGFMRQIVTNMREESPLRLNPLYNAQRILHRRVRGMRFMPQRVQKKNIQSLQLMERRLRYLAVIGEIRRASEAEAVDLRFSMNQSHRLEARPKKVHRTVNRPQLQLRQAAILVIGVKNVAEHAAQKSRSIGTSIKRQPPWLVTVTQRAQIVDAKNVVGVGVRVEHRIQPRDALAD